MGNKLGFNSAPQDPAKLSDISDSHVTGVFQLRDEVYFAHKPKSLQQPAPGEKAHRPRDPRRPSTAPGFNFEMKPRPAYQGPHPQAHYKPGMEPRDLRDAAQQNDEEVARDNSKFDVPTANTGVLEVKSRTYARCGRGDGRLYFLTARKYVPPEPPREERTPTPAGSAREEAEAAEAVLGAIDGLLADIEAATGEAGDLLPQPLVAELGLQREELLVLRENAVTPGGRDLEPDSRPASAADNTRRRIGAISERVRQTLKLVRRLESRRISSSGELGGEASGSASGSTRSPSFARSPPPDEPGPEPEEAPASDRTDPPQASSSSKASLANVTVRLRGSAALSLPPIDEAAEEAARRRPSRGGSSAASAARAAAAAAAAAPPDGPPPAAEEAPSRSLPESPAPPGAEEAGEQRAAPAEGPLADGETPAPAAAESGEQP